MFKFAVVVVVWVGLVHGDRPFLMVPKPIGEKIMSMIAKCSGPNDPSPAHLIDLVRAGKYLEDEHFRKLIHCSYRTSGFAKDDGRMNIDAAGSVFPGNMEFVKILKDCDIVGPNPVETTFLSFKCFQDTSPVLYDVQY